MEISSVNLELEKALDCIFSISSLLPTTPILEWDPSSKSFFSRGPGHRKYLLFKLVNFSDWTFIILNCLFTIFYSDRVINVMASVLYLVCSFLILLTIRVMLNHTEEITTGFANMKKLLQQKGNPDSHRKEKVKGNWGKISLNLRFGYCPSAVLTCLFVPIVGIMENIDMFHTLQLHLFPTGNWNTGCFMFRVILSYIAFLEWYRIFAILIGTIFYWLEMEWRQLQKLKRLRGHAFYEAYLKFQLCFKILEEAMDFLVYFVMSTFFAMIVLGNTIVVNFSDQIPPSIWWYVPILSGSMTVVLYVSLPFIADCHEGTEALISLRKSHLWKGKRSRNERKMEQRMLRGMRPVSVKCGGCYIVKKDTKSTYFNGIVQRTVDAVLLTQN